MRFPRLASNSIARGLALSLIFHLVLFGTVELGYRLGLWKSSLFEVLSFDQARKLDPRSEAKKREDAQKEEIVPIIFVDVDPSQTSKENPKDTKYYSSRNSIAGNPDIKIETKTPKITGTQDKVAKTMDKARSQAMPLQPAPQVASNADAQKKEAESKETQTKQAEPEPKSIAKPGDLAMARPVERPILKPKPSFSDTPEAEAPRPRPRRLAEVRNERSSLAGEKMKQDGGVKRFAVEGLDVKATPFGSYDQAIIEAIQSHWFNLLDERSFTRNDTGKVVITFILHADGRVTDVRIGETTVTDILGIICQRAVNDPAPFLPWPNDMRRLVGSDHRYVRFTFYYN